ncbi:MAG: sulfite exporter TauE/SafE family protein [Nitrospirae bacterium]|nr:sulfite exporter TauE/SafE family protein [Nitrospirota bacterium]
MSIPVLGIVAVAHAVETITGFGATIIALSAGAFFLPLDSLVVALVLVGWLQSLWLVARGFRHVEWKFLLYQVLPLCGIGFPLGIFGFAKFPQHHLKTALGLFVVAVAAMELLRLRREKVTSKELPFAARAGLLAAGGFFHGLFATGGPLVVYFASRAILDKSRFRSTLSALWLILNSILILSYLATSRLQREPALLAASLLPALAIGILAGEQLHSRVNEVVFRILVQVVLILTGAFLLA